MCDIKFDKYVLIITLFITNVILLIVADQDRIQHGCLGQFSLDI